MKTKTINTILVLIGLNSFASAENILKPASTYKLLQETGAKSFDGNTRIINVGIGIAGRSYYRLGGNAYTSSPAFSLTYEQPWPQRIGPGYLGVGAYFGYQNARYRNDYYYLSNYYYEHNWNYVMVAARGVYHWDVLNSEKAEVYGGALLGLRIQTYKYATNNPNANGNDYRLNEGSVYPVFSAFAGARYYFAKKVAVYGEIGSGVSYLTGGLSFKF